MIISKIKSNKIAILGWLVFLLSACSGTSSIDPPAADNPTAVIEDIPASSSEEVDPVEIETEAPPTAVENTAQEPESAADPVMPTDKPPAVTEARPTRSPASKYEDLEIITLLPPDAIPAIDDPQFLPATAADEFYDADELVLGVNFAGDARAYSVPFLSNHEIVNDNVGGVKIAVTW